MAEQSRRPFSSIVDSIMIDFKQVTDDSFLVGKEQYIADKIHDVRETLIRSELADRKSLDDAYYSHMDCISLECVYTECTVGGISFRSNEKMYVAELPELVTGVGWKDIAYIGGEGFTNNFSRRTLKAFGSNIFRRYYNGGTVYTRIGNKLVFTNLENENQKLLTASLLLKVPSDACNYYDEMPYPVPSVYKLMIMVKKDLVSTWNISPDVFNDASGLQMGGQSQPEEVDAD